MWEWDLFQSIAMTLCAHRQKGLMRKEEFEIAKTEHKQGDKKGQKQFHNPAFQQCQKPRLSHLQAMLSSPHAAT